MIYALEGPDGVGKSTLFDALQVPHVVKVQPFRSKCTPELEAHSAHLWRQIAAPEVHYLVDRSVFISSHVYAKLWGRECLVEPWLEGITPVLMRLPLAEHSRRLLKRGDPLVRAGQLERLYELYEEVLKPYDAVELDAYQPLATMVQFMEGLMR